MDSPKLYRPDIDGLRAVAVLTVMVYHLNANWLPGGFVGVDIFFVISGFVVTGALVASRAKTPLAYIDEFYARRLARIMPVLVVVLCVSALFATLFIPQAWLSELSDRTARFAFIGLSNWVMQQNDDAYFAPRAEFNPYTHTWSLGVEEQFYLIAPILIFLWLYGWRADHAQRWRARMLGMLGLICLGSFLGSWYATKTHPAVAFYFFGFRFWELGLGVLLYLVTFQRVLHQSRSAIWLSGLLPWAGVVLIVLACLYAKADNFPWPWALPAVFGTALVIGGVGARMTNPVRRLLAEAPMLWIGKRSYSLYLWHWPVFVILRWTIGIESLAVRFFAIALSIGLAALSYRYVETPLRHNALLERWRPRYRIAFFVALTALGWCFVAHLFTNASRYSLSTVTRHAADWHTSQRMPAILSGTRRCEVILQYHPISGGMEYRFNPVQCRYKAAPSKMFVLGDSHALAYFQLFEQFAAETGRPVSVFSFTGCPYIDFRAPMPGLYPGCDAFTYAVQQRVLERSVPGDLMFLPSLRIVRFTDQWARITDNVTDIMYSPDALKLREAALQDAKEWLHPFANRQIHIVFEAPKPIFRSPPFRCSDWFNRSNPICAGGDRQPRFELERLRAPILSAMQELTDTMPGVTVWDPFPVLCPGDTCLTKKDGRPLFFDADHLSGWANVVLYPDFKAFMDAVYAKPLHVESTPLGQVPGTVMP